MEDKLHITYKKDGRVIYQKGDKIVEYPAEQAREVLDKIDGWDESTVNENGDVVVDGAKISTEGDLKDRAAQHVLNDEIRKSLPSMLTSGTRVVKGKEHEGLITHDNIRRYFSECLRDEGHNIHPNQLKIRKVKHHPEHGFIQVIFKIEE